MNFNKIKKIDLAKILLVNDGSKQNKEFLKNLESKDYQIILANSGDALLQDAASEHPDLIILDTEIDGYAVCSKLKSDTMTQNIPVLLHTIWDEGKGLEIGAIDYLIKPCHSRILKARVKNYLTFKKQKERLETISGIDGLTGLTSRYRFNEVIEQQWQQGIRGISYLSLMMIEIDDFKQFNAGYSHAVADDCLKQVAKALENTIGRSTDMLFRYGVDKFACILPLTDKKGALNIAKRFRESITDLNIPHAHSAKTKLVSISQGISTRQPYPNSIQTLLIGESAKALLDARIRGSNQIVSIW
ncbi:MAG: diguanylate cyclase [Thiomargarita sp.]|nr:diguanylate cyclase [Thiomargarita sp.]